MSAGPVYCSSMLSARHGGGHVPRVGASCRWVYYSSKSTDVTLRIVETSRQLSLISIEITILSLMHIDDVGISNI